MRERQKVVCYITPGAEDKTRICVFEHADYPEAGIQVPAGSIDPGESSADAALREAFEESGIGDLRIERYLGTFTWYYEKLDEMHHRHIYHLTAPESQPETWEHIVTAGDGDKGLHFSLRWLGITTAEQVLSGDQGRYLHLLP